MRRPVQHGGLKLMILIRIAPTPIFWANLTFATVKASLSDFVITYSVVNLKYALYVYIGHTAGDLLSAAAGDTTPDGSASGSAADDDVPLGANVQTMQLVVSVAGMVCGVVALGVVGVYTKRELAKAGASAVATSPEAADGDGESLEVP